MGGGQGRDPQDEVCEENRRETVYCGSSMFRGTGAKTSRGRTVTEEKAVDLEGKELEMQKEKGPVFFQNMSRRSMATRGVVRGVRVGSVAWVVNRIRPHVGKGSRSC